MTMFPSRLTPSFAGLLATLVLVGCQPGTEASQAAAEPAHPLDPLTQAEYGRAVDLLRSAGHVDSATRFVTLEVEDPDKATVLAWREGEPIGRSAFAIVKQGLQTFEGVVDLTRGSVTSWREIPGVQPSVLGEEMAAVGDILGRNQRFVAALAARGFTIDKLLCAPWTLGNYAIPEHAGRRLLKTACFVIAGGGSPFTRPIEGLWAIVDLNAHEVVEIHDDAVIPVTDAPAATDEQSVASKRTALNPVRMVTPNGSNVTLHGHVLEWDNWSLHYRMEKRSGLVISTVRYHDGDRERSVLYRGALAELFVPYMDPEGNWFSRTFMDAGEYGFGASATPLEAGVDCPESGRLVDALVPDDHGVPAVVPGAICIFERNAGDPAWRHFDNILGTGFEGRRSVELVIRMIAAVGNYDYFLDWTFTQDGRIKVRIGASGYDGLKGVLSRSMGDSTAAAETGYGTLVAPGLVAANHDHFFSLRLDLDVDGPGNSFAIDRLTPKDFDGPRSGWVVQSRVARTERDAMIDYDPARPAYWRVFNPTAPGPVGHSPGYLLRPGNTVAYSLLTAGDMAQQRAVFTTHQLWVTPERADERYPAGDYVNQSPGGQGLSAWTAANRPIENTDLVLWYTAGFHHVPRTEDFPIMPSAWEELELVPFNFFGRNPALDVRTGWRGDAANGAR